MQISAMQIKSFTKLFKILLITLVLLGLILPNFSLNLAKNQIQAEEITEESLPEERLFEEPKFPIEPSLPGRIEGTGTYFEIKDSEYLNVALKSSEEIKVVLESIPRMISINIEDIPSRVSTNLTLEGLEPNKTYYQYQDSYKNEAVFVSDGEGSYKLIQDLTQPHHIWFQEIKGTTFIDKDTILDHDITGSVEITANNITLDCNGYSITGEGTGYGIYLNNKSSVTIKNCTVTNFSYGIHLGYSNNNNLINNTILNNSYGIILGNSTSNTLTNNLASNASGGINLSSSSNNILTNNTIKSNAGSGISLYYYSHNNTLSGNTILNNDVGINIGGISSYNTLIDNIVKSNNNVGILIFGSYNTILIGNTVSNNHPYGIILSYSNSKAFTNNTILNNGYGVYLFYVASNKIYHNNFIDNDTSAYVTHSGGFSNLFDNGYPSGGNYWSDYTGVDEKKGTNQNEAGPDGIGDTPYTFFGGQDRYPFMREIGWEGPVGQPIPFIVLDAESQLFQTTNNALTTIDDTYIEMVADTAIDITRSIFAKAAGKAVNKIIQIDADVPLRERGLLEGMRTLGTELAIELAEPILNIVKENLTVEGVLFPERVKMAHQDFIVRQVNLSLLADLDSIVFDISEKKAIISEIPTGIIEFKSNVFDKIEYAQDQGQKFGTYLMWGGISLIAKGAIFAPTGPVNLPVGLKMLAASHLVSRAQTVSDFGEVLYLIYKFADVLEDEIQITNIYHRQLQRVVSALETSELPNASGQINQVFSPTSVRLDKVGQFGATFQNIGPVEVDARLSVNIQYPNGEIKGPFTTATKKITPSGEINFSVDIPFPGFLGIFGTTGIHKAIFSVRYGILSLEEATEVVERSFKVIRRGDSFFKFFSSGSPLIVGIFVQNNDEVVKNYSVVDEVPKELAADISLIEFITPPTRILETDPKIEWRFSLNPGENITIFYRIPNPTIDIFEEIIFPTATLTSDTNIEEASVIAMTSQEIEQLSAGALQLLRQTIESLPNSAFKGTENVPANLKNTLLQKISEVIGKIEEGAFEDALNKLTHDIRPKIGGDSNVKEWIISSKTQEELLPLVDQLISTIRLLILTKQ